MTTYKNQFIQDIEPTVEHIERQIYHVVTVLGSSITNLQVQPDFHVSQQDSHRQYDDERILITLGTIFTVAIKDNPANPSRSTKVFMKRAGKDGEISCFRPGKWQQYLAKLDSEANRREMDNSKEEYIQDIKRNLEDFEPVEDSTLFPNI